MAEAYHVTPYQVAQELYEDPEQLSLVCLPLLHYARAKHALDNSKGEKDLEAWKDSKVMAEAWKNTADLKKERDAKKLDG